MRLALDATGVGLWSLDLATGVTTWNRRMYELMGLDTPINPDRYLQYVHTEDQVLVQQATRTTMDTGQFHSLPHRFVRPDGKVRWMQVFGRVMHVNGAPARIVGGNIDITEQRELEDRFRAAHRLETVGQLAAGISHNFNNLLATILPAIELARSTTRGDVQAALEEAATAGTRAAELVRQVTTWSRKDATQSTTIENIDALVERVVGMCRRFFEPTFIIDVRAKSGVAVRCQLAELEQAVMNLLVNARDALRDSNSALPRIEASCERVSDNTVRVRITDNGPGIEPQILGRVFEPFFTTKPIGSGTGLGLATVMACATQMGGTIRCDSTPGRGATFELFLPIAREVRAPVTQSQLSDGGGAVVLIVDDEAPLRRAIARLLTRHGYKVIQAEDGRAALAVMNSAEPISVVLLDQAMPSGPGHTWVPQMRALRPGLPILFHTGHDVTEEHRKLVDDVLFKPVPTDALLTALATHRRATT
ncbi:MAG: ATP-binding protein [Archangium sp.]